MSKLIKMMLPPAIIVGGIVIMMVMNHSTKPLAPKPAQEKVLLVDVQTVQKDRHQIFIPVSGIVEPKHEYTMIAEVDGEVVAEHANLQPGARVKKGEILVQIDDREYVYALKEAESALASARYQLALEQGQQRIAAREFGLLEGTLRQEDFDPELTLRRPQLAERQAVLAAAEAAVLRAKMDVERASILAPCDAVILEETVALGQYVPMNQTVATLACSEAYHLDATVLQSDIAWIDFKGQNQQGSEVILKRGEAQILPNEAHVMQPFASVDEAGRMIQLRIEVSNDDSESPLFVNEYLKGHILGKYIENAAAVPRAALRADDQIWVVKDGRLAVVNVEVAYRGHDKVYVTKGLSEGDVMITSYLNAPVPGTQVRFKREVQ